MKEGTLIPQLETLLHICYQLQIPLFEFLTNPIRVDTSSSLSNKIVNTTRPSRQIRRLFNPVEIQKTLEATLADTSSNPLSMAQVARNLKYDPNHIYQYFPELCSEISQRFAMFQKQKQCNMIQKYCINVREAVFYLGNEGEYPSKRRIHANFGISTRIFTIPEVKQAWRDALIEVGIKRRYQSPQAMSAIKEGMDE